MNIQDETLIHIGKKVISILGENYDDVLLEAKLSDEAFVPLIPVNVNAEQIYHVIYELLGRAYHPEDEIRLHQFLSQHKETFIQAMKEEGPRMD